MCCSQLFAAPVVKEKLSPLHPDSPESEESYAEVPIESIQQFVQIYGIVRDNYVDEKSDDALFLQAIKGLVSGLTVTPAICQLKNTVNSFNILKGILLQLILY